MILFSYLTDFNYFPLKIVSRNLLDQNKSKMTILKGVVDGFIYFSLISVILFSNQDHSWYYATLFYQNELKFEK
jgi:hypothetical protein